MSERCTRTLRWACSVLVALLVACGVRAARAAVGHTTILLMRAEGDERVVQRLRAELLALGWGVKEVSLVDAQGAVEAPSFTPMLKALGALAVVRASPNAAAVELWVAQRASLSLVHDRVTSPVDDVLAVLAVEALRAQLLRLGMLPTPDTRTPSSSLIPALPSAERERLFWLGGAPALVLSPGGLDPSLQAQLGLRVEMSARWSAALWAALPLTRAELDLSNSEEVPAPGVWADASVGVYGARLNYRPLRAPPWNASLGVGVALSALHMQAHAPEPLHGTSETMFAVGPVLGGDLSFEALPGIRLAASFLLGSMFPRSVLEFETSRVAAWGRPFGSAALGIELALPGVYR